MTWLSRLFAPLVKPTITNSADVRHYVVLVTAVATVVVLMIDVTSQLCFFATWGVALRSWALTVFSAAVTAVPISLLIARSQRDLFRAKRDLDVLSRTDDLTGLPNRRALMERVEAVAPDVMILVIVDIDRFKLVNDTYGHRAGDAVIRKIGQVMAAGLNEFGFVGRLGGEEFAVLAPFHSVARVLAALETFRREIASVPLTLEGVGVPVSVSAGAAIRAEHETFDQLYSEADEALYRAKASGRNRIELSPRLVRLNSTPPARAAA